MDTRLPRAALMALGLVGALAPAGCSEDAGHAVAVKFAARVGSAPFSCTATYPNIGTTSTTVAPTEFKMYVHDVRLVRAGGEEVAIDLSEDDAYQRGNVALLDFEDGTGTCTTGSPDTNLEVRGTVPHHDDYVGVKFVIGLPEAVNHLDGARAPAPFNVPGMWWAWKGGYKFIRLDLDRVDMPEGEESAYYHHLGATSCDGTPASGFTCRFVNHAEVSLDMDVDTQSVVFDIAQLYADSDLSKQPDFTSDFVAGCMAFEGDPECPAVFKRLGLSFESNDLPPSPQTVFSVQ